MTRLRKSLRRLGGNEDGAALVEFAFVAPVFLMLLMGAMDIGYQLYIRAILTGTLEQSARAGSLAGATQGQLTTFIEDDIFKILPKYARSSDNVNVNARNYTDFSSIDSAEKITVDHNDNGMLDEPEITDEDGNGTIDTGDCWLDEDENGEFGVNEGANGIGGSDDGVYYTVTVTMPALFPLWDMLNRSPNQTIVAKTLVVNQPYAAQTTRPTVCLT